MANTNSPKPTRGQLQRTLSQQIQKLYKEDLGHTPSKVTCQIIDDKVMIVVEDSLTKLEKLLIEGEASETGGGDSDVEGIRSDLDTIIRPKITALVEESLAVSVIDVLSDTTLGTGRTGMVVVLSNNPEMNSNGKS
jgi:uncharacterized protein YbcI